MVSGPRRVRRSLFILHQVQWSLWQVCAGRQERRGRNVVLPPRHLAEGPDLAEGEGAGFGRGCGLKGARQPSRSGWTPTPGVLTTEAPAALGECGGGGPGHPSCLVPLQVCGAGAGASDPGFQRAGRSPAAAPRRGWGSQGGLWDTRADRLVSRGARWLCDPVSDWTRCIT